VSTVAGGIGGQFIPVGAFGIDFALSAMFICLLVFQLRGKRYVSVALIAGVLSIILSITISGNSYIILASIIAATIGVIFQKAVRREK